MKFGYKFYLLIITLIVFGCDDLNEVFKVAPTIDILEPGNRFVYQEEDPVELVMEFADVDGFISKIEIIANKSILLHQDSSSEGIQSPYNFVHVNTPSGAWLPIGIHLIEVIVYDNDFFTSTESLLIEIVKPVSADLSQFFGDFDFIMIHDFTQECGWHDTTYYEGRIRVFGRLDQNVWEDAVSWESGLNNINEDADKKITIEYRFPENGFGIITPVLSNFTDWIRDCTDETEIEEIMCNVGPWSDQLAGFGYGDGRSHVRGGFMSIDMVEFISGGGGNGGSCYTYYKGIKKK